MMTLTLPGTSETSTQERRTQAEMAGSIGHPEPGGENKTNGSGLTRYTLDYWLTVSRRSSWIRGGWIAGAAGFFLLGLVLLGWGGLGASLYLRPRGDALFVFFKESFLVFVVVCAAWSIAALRPSPQRREEFQSLVSLPLHGRVLYRHLFLTEWIATLWVPIWLAVVYAGLSGVAPWPFLFRLTLATLFFHAAAVVALHAGHLFLMARKGSPVNLIYRVEAWIVLGVVLCFGAAVLSCIVAPGLITGTHFYLLLLFFLLFIFAGLRLNDLLFEQYRLGNAIWLVPLKVEQNRSAVSSLGHSGLHNPWLWKSFVRSRRQANKGAFVLTGIFIALAYLASMNNALPSDRAAVLLALTLIYSAIFVHLAMQHTGEPEEPPQQIYALPVRPLPWLASMLIPPFLWLAGVCLIIAALIATYSLPLALAYLLKSLLSGLAMLFCGIELGVLYYPDVKRGQRIYSYYLLTTLILSALLYRYHPFIIAGMALIPTLRTMRMRYYRI
jgi:hypothetical protein